MHLSKLSEHIFYLILHSFDVFIVSYTYYFIILILYVIFLKYCEVSGNNMLFLYLTSKIILVISTLYCIKKELPKNRFSFTPSYNFVQNPSLYSSFLYYFTYYIISVSNNPLYYKLNMQYPSYYNY